MYALTIDDGPSDVTPQMLTKLANAGVKATFFLMGQNMNSYPATVASELAQQHSLASHSFSHPDLTTISLAQASPLRLLLSCTLSMLHPVLTPYLAMFF